MTFGSYAAVTFASVGLLVAVFFGVRAMRQLAKVRNTPLLGAAHADGAARSEPSDPANDVPTMRFKGEPFERTWQGSRGYERPDPPSENWVDRLIIPVVTPLRPSRFSDPSYWRRYLPGVFVTRAVLFFGLPLVLVLASTPTTGTVGTFMPSPAQRTVPLPHAPYVTDLGGCDAPTGEVDANGAARGMPLSVSYTDDGSVFSIPPGRLVAVTYLYGKPVFSPGVPLCVPTGATVRDTSRVVVYEVTGSGAGYIYIPQPTGTIVAKIEISPGAGLAVVSFVLVGLTAVVMCVDIVVMLRLRRATRSRWTQV